MGFTFAILQGAVVAMILGTLSIDDESDDEDEPEVILTDKTILRMSCFVFADVTRRLLFVENVKKVCLAFSVVRKYLLEYFFSFHAFNQTKTK